MSLNGRGGQCFLFPLTHGWWQMPSGGGSSSGKKTTGSGGVNLFGLLSCVLNHKEGGCKGVPCRCRVPSSRADEEQQVKRQVGRAATIEAFFICPCFALLCSFVPPFHLCFTLLCVAFRSFFALLDIRLCFFSLLPVAFVFPLFQLVFNLDVLCWSFASISLSDSVTQCCSLCVPAVLSAGFCFPFLRLAFAYCCSF